MNCVIKMRNGFLFIFLCLVIITGCYKKADPVTSPAGFAPEGVSDSNVTYTNYIHNILKTNCSTCHGKGGSAEQFWDNTNTYENAEQFGTRIMETIVEGSMPPVPKKPFSETDKNLITAWINRGSPQ